MKRTLLLAAILMAFIGNNIAQNVFNPADPIVRYASGAAYGSAQKPDSNVLGLQKWVCNVTNGVSSGSGSFKALSETYKAYFINFFNNRLTFRVKFPRSYTDSAAVVGKKYPVMLFMHGAGEVACVSNGGIYNNEKQLVIGGKFFGEKVENGQFDGFLVYPQLRSKDAGCWGEWGGGPSNANYNTIMTFLDSLAKYARSDNDRLFVDGLSGGGVATWRLAELYPQRVAKIAPTSAAGFLPGTSSVQMNYPAFVHIPIWLATGGKDTNPSPYMASVSTNEVSKLGGNIRTTLYPTLGHASWDTHWAEADFMSFMNDMHKANPLVFFNRNEFCPDSTISARLGITAGFYAYEWQKDGQTIARRTNGVNTIDNNASIIAYSSGGNEITVKSFGTYRVRFKRSLAAEWSAWSMKPAVIKSKTLTMTPMPVVVGIKSKLLPSLDGKTTVTLQLPENFQNYQWYRTSDNVLVGATQTFEAPVGTYKARYSEPYGCGTEFSPVFTVASANGNPKPDGARNLSASPLSQTVVRLDWNDNPNAGTNETGFEIYRGVKAGGPYTLLAVTGPNVITYQDASLLPNTTYYYVVRAIAETGAAPASNEILAKTEVDNTLPSAPSALEYRGSSQSTVNLRWKAASDDAGISRYDIFVNGTKMYSTTNLSFTVASLDSLDTYTFTIKAIDKAGNVSAPSNQVTAYTHRQGLKYKYYQGTYNNLPNFSNITPLLTGVMDTVNAGAGVRARDDNFAFLWEGLIYIPVNANYTFETESDDGSKLYIDVPYTSGATALVNNDGAHSLTSVSGTKYLTQGYHQIVVSFFEVGGGEEMNLYWSNSAGMARERIPKGFFATENSSSSSPLVSPSALVATTISHNKIALTWVDKSSDETGFEIVRSASMTGTYIPVATTAANAQSYSDSGLVTATKYFYKIRAINAGAASEYTSNFTEVNWKFNSNYTDANGVENRTLSSTNASFNTDRQEGTHSVSIANNGYLSLTAANGAFLGEAGYNQRTVALWMKPSNTTGRRMVFDFGDNANGFGMRFNSDDIIGGIASGSVRKYVTLSNFATSSNWVRNGWNHVALVYNANSLMLYINGVKVKEDNTVSFSSIGTSTNAPRIGSPSTNSSASASVFNDNDSYSTWQGLIDNMYVIRGALSAEDIGLLKQNTLGQSAATTLAAPAPPAAPSALVATALSTDAVRLTWNDNSNNETFFEIWRSSGDKTNNRLVAKAAGGTGTSKTFTDTALFANVTYYYKVRAAGAAISSAYTAEASAKTLNTKPDLKNIKSFTMKYNTSFSLPIKATDEDGDVLTFSTYNLPSTFAVLQNTANGNANIVFTPNVARQGSYPITVYVSDGNNGRDTASFILVVNSNDVPVLSAVQNITIPEGGSFTVPLAATDNNGPALMAWYFEGLPSFGSFTNNNNGSGSLAFKPGYAASGIYEVTAFLDDGRGAWTSRIFTVTVNEVEPQGTVQMNFRSVTGSVPLWNDIQMPGLTNANMKDTKGVASSIGVSLSKGSFAASQSGSVTGNNSGAFPDNVLKDLMTWGFNTGNNAADTIELRVTGLDLAKKYNFTFMGGYSTGGDASSQTKYKIGNEVVAINYYQNTSQTASIQNVQPNASGQVFITLIGDPAVSRGGVLNALVINAMFEDGTKPAKPLNFTGTHVLNAGVQLNWSDRAYNESAYQVYRSAVKAGPYTLLNPGAANRDSVNYLDVAVVPESTYYYYVAGVNASGTGATSDTVLVKTGNNQPVITALADIYVKTDGVSATNFSVTDDPGDIVTVTIENKPSFVALENLGNSNYRITVSPSVDHLGWFNLKILAADNKGAVASKSISLSVNDKNTRSVFINLGNTGKSAPLPWNNWLGSSKAAGVTSATLNDETNQPTPFTVTLVTGWSTITDIGHMTGNNSGVYPDSVLQSGLSDNLYTHTIRFNNLNNSKKYNLVFVGSQNEGGTASLEYSSGSTKDTMDARNNTNQTTNLNGLVPVNGQITVNLVRIFDTQTAYLNAIAIEEYDPSLTLLSPINLYVEPFDRTSTMLSWSDRTADEAVVQGYVLERASDSLFTQNVVSIGLPANSSTYKNTGLTPNTRYWYRVRARSSVGAFSGYSNRVKTITPASIVYVDFNYTLDNGPAPWNSTFSSPSVEGTFPDLKNQSGVVSGLTLELTKLFNGEFTAGMNTGNNSGIVPDKVLASNYWLDNTQQSQFKVTGLNHSRRYRFGFIGSSSSSGWFKGNYTATYTINGRTVYLNSWLNKTKIVYIGDVVPNENGEVLLDFSTTATAVYGFNAGILIEDYTDNAPGGGTVSNVAQLNESDNNVVSSPDIMVEQLVEANANAGKMYPNPFADFLNMDFNNTSGNNNISVDVYDVSGRLSYHRNYGKLPVGNNTLRLSAADSQLQTGVYIVSLNVNGKSIQANKVIRTKN